MRRIQIHIEEDLDEALAAEAAEQKTSKAALIRKFVAEKLRPLPPIEDDPITQLIGRYIDEEPGDIDEIVYGR